MLPEKAGHEEFIGRAIPMKTMPRYAIYYAPPADSAWWAAGRRWFGRDPLGAEESLQIPDPMLEGLSCDARRYGLHATMMAPFRLANGFLESHLIEMADAFCLLQRPLQIGDVQVRMLARFLALRPTDESDAVAALATRCVTYFDLLRATPNDDELAKRRRPGLSKRQESLLRRWGYPYTEEEFRFHLTLTDSLAGIDDDAVAALSKAAQECFARAWAGTPMELDELALFREEMPGGPFLLWRRFPFRQQQADAALPVSGRLFFVVGPSCSGKDTLLDWVRQRLPSSADIVFARRTITRPPHSSETHEVIDAAGFWELAAGGHFAMQWQANDLCYGVRRGIQADLKAGRDVVVNGSREYVPELLKLFPDAQVIWIEADVQLLRARIEARRRETGEALLRRIERSTAFRPPEDQNVIRIDNSGPVEVAGQRLLDILGGCRRFAVAS
jgi:ribose 1,5-bisphosphokinase